MDYATLTDDELINAIAQANFRSARFGEHRVIDQLWVYCQKNGKLAQYQAGIDASIATYGA